MAEQYIDIHSHILPGVDDGAEDMDMTMEMVDAAYRQGVRTMIATPHYYPGHVRCPREHLEETFQEAASMIKEKYSDFTLFPGNEIYYREEAVEKLRNKRIYTMAYTRYILLEFSPGAQYKFVYNAVRRCVEEGYYPILAHIERYQCLWKNEKNIRELVQLGAYMQINAENFSCGLFSAERRWCLKLAQRGLMHFIGSDCHNMNTRCPNLKQAVDYLSEKLDEETFRKIIYDNPAKLLTGEYLK